MANNRMYLRCRVCQEQQMIATYYPAGGALRGAVSVAGWASPDEIEAKLDAFFVSHAHDMDRSMWGGHQYEVAYEIEAGPR